MTQKNDKPLPQGVILNPYLHYGTFIALLLLFCLCILWELWLDPMVAGGSIYFLKALPLMFALYGVFKGNLYTMQWTAMLVLLYFMEGVVRWYADISILSQRLGMIETILSVIVFFGAILYVKPAKQHAKSYQKK
ncbi:DUF2069 domain-containing protein [Pelistega ratti]|uniref:DUF2069 domain-containing protein n=1 Tax=Pelistega ratti TaxID=2652177 RepID=UPI00135A8DE4|nr:DUF2069 domain-containing protein [Pelistega ratti]